MLAPVSLYARRLSTRCNEQSSRPQSLCQLQFHWHKLGHAQSCEQCNQSKTTGTSNRGPAWSNKCTCQTSSICSLTEKWQEDGQATVHVYSSPKINNLRSSDWSKGLKNFSSFLPPPPFFLLFSFHPSFPPFWTPCLPLILVLFLPSFLPLSIHPVHLCIFPFFPPFLIPKMFASLHYSFIPITPAISSLLVHAHNRKASSWAKLRIINDAVRE